MSVPLDVSGQLRDIETLAVKYKYLENGKPVSMSYWGCFVIWIRNLFGWGDGLSVIETCAKRSFESLGRQPDKIHQYRSACTELDNEKIRTVALRVFAARLCDQVLQAAAHGRPVEIQYAELLYPNLGNVQAAWHEPRSKSAFLYEGNHFEVPRIIFSDVVRWREIFQIVEMPSDGVLGGIKIVAENSDQTLRGLIDDIRIASGLQPFTKEHVTQILQVIYGLTQNFTGPIVFNIKRVLGVDEMPHESQSRSLFFHINCECGAVTFSGREIFEETLPQPSTQVMRIDRSFSPTTTDTDTFTVQFLKQDGL